MSEKESTFTKIWGSILGGFLLALILGAFAFYKATVEVDVEQTTIIKNYGERIDRLESFDKYFPSNGEFHRSIKVLDDKINNNQKAVETIKEHVREDFNTLNGKIDKLIELQLKQGR